MDIQRKEDIYKLISWCYYKSCFNKELAFNRIEIVEGIINQFLDNILKKDFDSKLEERLLLKFILLNKEFFSSATIIEASKLNYYINTCPSINDLEKERTFVNFENYIIRDLVVWTRNLEDIKKDCIFPKYGLEGVDYDRLFSFSKERLFFSISYMLRQLYLSGVLAKEKYTIISLTNNAFFENLKFNENSMRSDNFKYHAERIMKKYLKKDMKVYFKLNEGLNIFFEKHREAIYRLSL